MENNKIGLMYVDKRGVLRMVMENCKNGFVRGVDVLNMNIDGIVITDELESYFSGHGYSSKRHKVLWV